MAATTARGRRCGSLNPKCGKHLVVGIPLVPEGNCECFLCHYPVGFQPHSQRYKGKRKRPLGLAKSTRWRSDSSHLASSRPNRQATVEIASRNCYSRPLSIWDRSNDARSPSLKHRRRVVDLLIADVAASHPAYRNDPAPHRCAPPNFNRYELAQRLLK